MRRRHTRVFQLLVVSMGCWLLTTGAEAQQTASVALETSTISDGMETV